MMLFRHAVRLVLREPGRSLAASVGVAIASALVASAVLLGTASGTTDPGRVSAELPLGAQVATRTGQVAMSAGGDASGALMLLFVFLALPGIVLAFALPRLAAAATERATRRQAEFLHARGATRRQLRTIFIEAAVVTAFAGSAAGVAVSAAIGLGLAPDALRSAGLPSFLGAGALSIALTTIVASLAAALSLRTHLGADVATRAPVRARLRGPEGRAGSAGLLSDAGSPRFQAYAGVVRARARSRRAGIELGRSQSWPAMWQSSEAGQPEHVLRPLASPAGASRSLAAREMEHAYGRAIVSAMSPSPDRRPV